MSGVNYECKPLQWDTDYFGLSSARVDLSGIVDKKGQDEIIGFCRGYNFVTIANLNNVKENNHWIGSRTNAFLSDMNIQFVKALLEKPDQRDENTYVANDYPRNQQIVDIAQKSFQYSRFFNDPNLPQEQAKSIYLHWTECAFGQVEKYFVVCKREGQVAGYTLFTMDDESSVIELLVVDEAHQGQRVGKSLLQTMEAFAMDNGAKKIKVGTQVDNVSAVQFYIKMGFTYTSCTSMYHLWGL